MRNSSVIRHASAALPLSHIESAIQHLYSLRAWETFVCEIVPFDCIQLGRYPAGCRRLWGYAVYYIWVIFIASVAPLYITANISGITHLEYYIPTRIYTKLHSKRTSNAVSRKWKVEPTRIVYFIHLQPLLIMLARILPASRFPHHSGASESSVHFIQVKLIRIPCTAAREFPWCIV